MDNLINIIFPPKCIFCRKTNDSIICDTCLHSLPNMPVQHCIICDRPSLLGVTHKKCLRPGHPLLSFSVYSYRDQVRQCIKNSKYGSKEFMALKVLCSHAAKYLQKISVVIENHILIPVPVSKRKFEFRGFNQAEIIASVLSKMLKLPLNKEGLVRIKETPAQFNYSRKERFDNISGAFTVLDGKKETIYRKKILLVDDICTTGATLLETSRTLYENGASEVRCFTLSKKVIDTI